ncbi:MAG: outer membrane lipoprotein carrier protein LolA [Planctomycetota bacterium]
MDQAQLERANKLLAAHAEQSRTIAVLVAQYVQRRTTKLAKDPLESRGEFLFVREPACVVFRATQPRESVVRLREAVYEVYRPQRKQLERFHLEGPELAQGLFAAVGGDVARLRRDFEVSACVADPADATRAQVRLRPRTAEVGARLQELVLTLRSADATLCAVAYRDQAGDLVEITLLSPLRNPPAPPSAEFELPKDTTIVEHTVPKKQ